MICQENSYLREYEVDVTHVDYKIDKLPNVRLSIFRSIFSILKEEVSRR